MLAERLPANSFRIDPFEAPLERFATLRLPGAERTLDARTLYAISYALCDQLGLVSVEPDVGAPIYGNGPAEPSLLEATRIGEALCWVTSAPPADRLWALRRSGIVDAWTRAEGAGVLVAQPDSGIAKHAELGAAMFRLDLAANFVEGGCDPTDPLNPGTANPGHGSGTASVLASRRAGMLSGAAPAASVIPIRCLQDVKVFDAAPVTRAILRAVEVGAHVISMSLGGIPSRAMHAAIRHAVDRDVLVVAAAGNCVRTVIWPARYPEVVAVAGSNDADGEWKGSSRGSAVDVTAPAELVWRAARSRAEDPLDAIGPGQGTSFATALTAGAAALWLSAHGRDAVLAEARSRGVRAQHLFRAALRASSRTPDGWDVENFGPGILDAGRLVDIALSELPAGAAESALLRDSVAAFIDEEVGPGAVPPDLDWPRYQAEIANIALTQARLGFAPADVAAEVKWAGTRPSPELSAALRRTGDSRLARFGELEGVAVARPPTGSPVVLPERVLWLPRASQVEGAGAVMGGTEATNRSRRLTVLRELESLIGVAEAARTVDAEILSGAEEAVEALASGAPLPTDRARFGLEALILLKGRPALRVRDGTLDLKDPRVAEWRDRLRVALSAGVIEPHLGRVGRIDADGAHIGTGFVVGDGLVLTNRHVLQAFAAPIPRRNDPARWRLLSDDVTIDFAERPSSQTAASRFRVVDVIGAGSREIDPEVLDLGLIDAALLAVETVNVAKTPLPAPGCLDQAVESADRAREVLVVGYPARPSSLPVTATNDVDAEVVARLAELFGADYGTKYAAPGSITASPGGVTADPIGHVFLHDATTLVGNSGSAILSLNAPQDFMGLHFGGLWRRQNYAHAIPRMRGWDVFGRASVQWSPAP
ncbi:S8 family serine peptidase [Sphingomonas sanguinis]|uniref:S8 family serine peptidase n=1 Tax=Sphingomonas sanguinis TaxID=33051 RepID=UPI001C55B34F|nr:S8 family serine peptidase [Sphingomonas sanguinis]QXT34876.1 S8 family serine peptidase [Sphingomonas sanguinis]